MCIHINLYVYYVGNRALICAKRDVKRAVVRTELATVMEYN